ncbi:hypothetical protein [Terracoccus luteus]|uniref:Uncharacterized protein n=1 Tax=Terracoccus luteus TaxID=53356 RepID=A0A839PX55_9MICO|nr:hypothetical protein [Terracoccus luteus]MBB2986566.1 hypothetical protein [Terracoccus luteus]MCP2171845.1 hypothetical protein [Terracoccus luteus]
MGGVKRYEQDYVDSCRARDESQAAMFHSLLVSVRGHDDDDPNGEVANALDSLETEFFNNMLLVLEGYFVHRDPDLEASPGGVLAEVRLLAASLMQNGGAVLPAPARSQHAELGLREGETVRLTASSYRRLSNAFFREIERRYTGRA